VAVSPPLAPASWRDSVDIGSGPRERGEQVRTDVEWRHDNRAGAWAASTSALVHARAEHGLLVAPAGGASHVVLAHVELRALPIVSRPGMRRRTLADLLDRPIAGRTFSPTPLRFAQRPLPEWTLVVNGEDDEPAGVLEMTLGLHPTASAVAMRWRWRGDLRVQLQLRPLLVMRPVGDPTREDPTTCQAVEVFHQRARVRPRRELPHICFGHDGTFVGSPEWRANFWTPGVVEVVMQPDDETHLVCALDALPDLDARAILHIGARDPRESR
jgi:hypothetical protein